MGHDPLLGKGPGAPNRMAYWNSKRPERLGLEKLSTKGLIDQGSMKA